MRREFRVEELAGMLGASQLTIRRDLQKLSDEKALIRTHGGCLASGRASFEIEYYKKVALNFELKQAIGKTAALQVKPGDKLLINDGSTTYHLASHLDDKEQLTVYTNSLAMISELSSNSNISLHILGGEYNRDQYSLSGGLTEHMLERLHFDLVFLGVDAIDSEGRCLVSHQREARLTEIMLKSGGVRILLADHTKVNMDGYVAYGTIHDFDMWITTPGMACEKHDAFEKKTTIVEAVV